MRLFRMAAVVMLAAAGTLATVSPAQAGGWATTLLDPLPERLEPGVAYTVGYWVLQHGSHPFEGDLGRTALRLTDDLGASSTHAGTPLPEAGHYAAALVFGHRGTWQLSSVQGVFADYEIGEVTVPGGIRVRPTPTPMVLDQDGAAHWGAIRPPLATDPGPAGTTASPAPAAAAGSPPKGGQSVQGPLLAGAGLAALGLALLLGWRSRWRIPTRRAPGPARSGP